MLLFRLLEALAYSVFYFFIFAGSSQIIAQYYQFIRLGFEVIFLERRVSDNSSSADSTLKILY